MLYYSEEWKNYRLSANILNNVCRYMNHQRLRCSAKAVSVDQIAVENWREHMFNQLNEKVSNAAVEMIERNRNGEIINTYAIKDVIHSYIDLGSLEAKDPKKPNGSDDLKVLFCGCYIFYELLSEIVENNLFSPCINHSDRCTNSLRNVC